MLEHDLEIDGKKYYRSRVVASVNNAPAQTLFNPKDITAVTKASEEVAAQLGKAGIAQRTPDLKFLQGILVTSSFNRNRDFLLPTEMAKSFTTARLKPIDIEHKIEEKESLISALDQGGDVGLSFKAGTNTIIGTIFDSALIHTETSEMIAADDVDTKLGDMWAQLQTADEGLIKDPFEQGANRFDIIIAGVMWGFLFPKTIADIVAEVEAGQRALSFEMFFPNFDLWSGGALHDPEERPDLFDAWLAKTDIGGQPVFRVIRNPLWGGVGSVRHPANPNGFDFMQIASREKREKLHLVSASLRKIEVKQISTEKSKSDVGTDEDERSIQSVMEVLAQMDIKEVMAQLNNLTDVKADKQVAEAKVVELTAKLEVVTKEAKDNAVKLAEASKKLDVAEASVKTLEEAKAEIQNKLDEATKSAEDTKIATDKAVVETKTKLDAADAQVVEYKKADLVAERLEQLTKANVTIASDKEEKGVEALASLDNDGFATLVATRTELKDALAGDGNSGSEEADDDTEEDADEAAKAQAKAAESRIESPVFDGTATRTYEQVIASMAGGCNKKKTELENMARLP